MGTEPWKNRKYIKPNCENCPVVYISWNTVTEFIKRLNEKEKVNKYRLPTEAEWEYSCRAGTKTAYYFGDDISKLGKYAWSAENTYSKKNEYAHPVALKKPNKWGLFDMHGNVWEMCSDWFGENYYHASPKVDPTGPPSGNGRVMRGGSYEFNGPALRCARRMETESSNRFLSDAGFRLVMEK